MFDVFIGKNKCLCYSIKQLRGIIMGVNVLNQIDVKVNDNVLDFLGKDHNVILSEISNSDRIYMTYLLKQYYLKLRDKLNISSDITFGLEIEFEEAMCDIIGEKLDEAFPLGEWCMVTDGSLSNGAEINSPVLRDSEKTWMDLCKVCEIVDLYAYVMDNTSAHIHIGTQILGNNPRYWRNFAILWATYENVIFRFLNGEFISPRSEIVKYASPVSLDYIQKMDRIEDRAKMINASNMFRLFDTGDEDIKYRRRKSVNFTNVSKLEPYKYNTEIDMNTVEFRSANGTFNPVIWQNNVNLITKLMLYCKSDKFNEDIINKRMRQIKIDGIPSSINKYSRIYMDQAIELADMIFDNNLDKVYFLRQYVKSGEVSTKPLVRSREFTRR